MPARCTRGVAALRSGDDQLAMTRVYEDRPCTDRFLPDEPSELAGKRAALVTGSTAGAGTKAIAELWPRGRGVVVLRPDAGSSRRRRGRHPRTAGARLTSCSGDPLRRARGRRSVAEGALAGGLIDILVTTPASTRTARGPRHRARTGSTPYQATSCPRAPSWIQATLRLPPMRDAGLGTRHPDRRGARAAARRLVPATSGRRSLAARHNLAVSLARELKTPASRRTSSHHGAIRVPMLEEILSELPKNFDWGTTWGDRARCGQRSRAERRGRFGTPEEGRFAVALPGQPARLGVRAVARTLRVDGGLVRSVS